ncbi:hypothetical protein [Actinomyces sp. ZJ308]|uniref:hypothetical protein n=1 Tax=Actinomyces sp. ZJ308 TaxID=2708342 RepID=UPI00141F0553|nr:hypothetical protein [Actinomyces sp. ZJ308]
MNSNAVEEGGGTVEGGIHHHLFGVVDVQEKSSLHPACTQASGDEARTAQLFWKIPGVPWNPL